MRIKLLIYSALLVFLIACQSQNKSSKSGDIYIPDDELALEEDFIQEIPRTATPPPPPPVIMEVSEEEIAEEEELFMDQAVKTETTPKLSTEKD
ncbi:MAG: hypothetical protein AAF806_24795, partial [Bacteroidota bacterium]